MSMPLASKIVDRRAGNLCVRCWPSLYFYHSILCIGFARKASQITFSL